MNLHAQNGIYRSNVSVQGALNGWQVIALGDNFIKADYLLDPYMTATGTYGLSYDYAVVKWFSLGAQATWNAGEIGAKDLSVTVNEKEYHGKAAIHLRRINLGFRPTFHYFNNNRFDFYSGFRVGVNYSKATLDIGTDEDITGSEVLDYLIGDNWLLNRSYRGVRPTVQFIPIAMRGYITEQIGFGIETAVGPTYYLSASINYRF